MELAILLFLLAAFLIGFKVLVLLFKAIFWIVSIPFQILGTLLGLFCMVLLLPLFLVGGILTAIFTPLLVFGPLIPIVLVLLGLYLIARA